jgi:hypothetical protein
MNALPGVGSDAIARRQKQAATVNFYAAIETHLGIQGRDLPRRARSNTPDETLRLIVPFAATPVTGMTPMPPLNFRSVLS